MTDLLDALGAAKEGSRELDCRIHAVVDNPSVMTDTGGYRGERPVKYTRLSEVIPNWGDDWSGLAMQARAPYYTTSIDAALQLVPEGWWLSRVNQYHTGDWPAGWWGVHLRHIPPWDRGEEVGEHKGSLPIAIVTAALRARAAHDSTEER